MIDLQKLRRLQEAAERDQREADRARGAHEQQLAQLQQEFGCKDEAAGQKLLERLERELEAQEKAWERALRKLESEHGDRLEGEA